MVLYCSAHEAQVLRAVVHKMTYHSEEEMVFLTTVVADLFKEVFASEIFNF